MSRLQAILHLRTAFAADLTHLRAGQAWLLEADALLSAAAGWEQQTGEQQTAEQQVMAFATWRDGVARHARRLPAP